MSSLERQLKELRIRHGVIGSAVVARAGEVLVADLPENVSRETFGVMCATILGAGTTASNELRAQPPNRVTLESTDARVLIFEAGRRAILVVVTPPGFEESRMASEVKNIMDEVRKQSA